jgi:REP element-mobilizing transposase RayT
LPGILTVDTIASPIKIPAVNIPQSAKTELEPVDLESIDPLAGVNAKTSWYPVAKSRSGGRKRILGPVMFEANYYHVMSRTCGGQIFFDDVEKEALRRILWRVAEFCGVQVLTYCVMSNHFHILASVPHRATWLQRFEGPEGDRRLLAHLRTLYSKSYIEQLEAEFREWRRQSQESLVQAKLECFKKRMGDLSRFVKEVKERFSRWYNRRHERRGTLWMDRFRSVLIEGNIGKRRDLETARVDIVRTMAAYIDLNPVRAALVTDSRDYPWCGYAEACAGNRKAQRGLSRVLGKALNDKETQGMGLESNPESLYASLLSGVAQAQMQGRHRDECETMLKQKQSPPLTELLRQRVREFSESLVLGSKDFVEEVFQANRSFFGAKRKEGARQMPVPDSHLQLFVARRVRPRPS